MKTAFRIREPPIGHSSSDAVAPGVRRSPSCGSTEPTTKCTLLHTYLGVQVEVRSHSATLAEMANFGRINAIALKIIIHLFFLMSNLMLVFALH